jgi:hypothetical protein
VTARNVTATNGSVAVDLSDTNDVTVDDITATDQSVALSWWTGAGGSVGNVVAENESIGAQLVGLSGVTVSGISEVNPRVGPAYFENDFLGIYYPDGPIQTYYDVGLTVSNLTAVNCSFGLEDIDSDGLTIEDVRDWGNGTAVELNGSSQVSIDRLFVASAVHGLVADMALNVTLVGSTVEDCSSYALYLLDAENDTIYGNNFVANDRASALGVYDPRDPQVELFLGIGMNFTWDGVGNYWSDWSGGRPYPIAYGVADTAPAPAFLSHWLDFVARGLTPGPTWRLAIGGHEYTTSAPLIALPAWIVPNGSLPYSVTPPPSWGVVPRTGTVLFAGANQTVPLEFTLPVYAVTYVESGLPAGTPWSVTLGGNLTAGTAGATTASLRFEEPNGTYPEAVTPVPGYYEAAVAVGSELSVLGQNVTVAIDFAAVVYGVTWVETGLPTGTVWGVTVDGAFHPANASIAAWNASNGTYSYVLSGVPGWHESGLPYLGTLTVTGRPLVLTTVWFEVHYPVTFQATGLPTGTAWTLVFDGRNQSLDGSTASFALPNGTYAFRVFASVSSSFQVSPSAGNLTVAGNGTTLTVAFSATPVAGGGPTGTPGWVYLALGGVAVAALAVAMAVRRSSRGGPPSSEEELQGEDLPVPSGPPRDDDV